MYIASKKQENPCIEKGFFLLHRILKNINFRVLKIITVSCIKLYNDLNNQFTKMQKITYLLNKRDLECMTVLENWIESTVTILKDNNFSESELISKYRGELIIERLRADKKMPKKKRELTAAIKVMNPLRETILKIIDPVSNKIEESERIINNMLSYKNFRWNEGLNYRDYILAVWRTLLNDRQTQIDAKTVLKLIGEDDALKLISNKLKPTNKNLD